MLGNPEDPTLLVTMLVAVKMRFGAGNQQERLGRCSIRDQYPPQLGTTWRASRMGKAVSTFPSDRGVIIGVPWKVSLCFNISQRDEVILAKFKRYLGCGTMRQRRDGVWYYEVNNLGAIRDNVIPFFDHYGFLSAKKQRDFAKFKQLATLLVEGVQDSQNGIEQILRIRSDMNDGGNRRYSDEMILEAFKNPQRLHARRDHQDRDDIVRSP